MANPWSIPAVGWTVIVMGWLFSPIITWFVLKLFARLICVGSKDLWKLEFDTVPALQAMLRDVEEKKMIGGLGAARDVPRSDLERLNKMDMHLKSALWEAASILDIIS